MSVKKIFWHFMSSNDPYSSIKSLLGSRLKGLYDAKRGVTVDSANNVSQWDDQSGNGYHLTQATPANRPKYNELDTIYFTSTSQHFLSNASIVAALQNSSIGMWGVQRATTAATFFPVFAQAGGSAFMGMRNNGATFQWGGTGSTGVLGPNPGNNNLESRYGLQVNNDVDINFMVNGSITTAADTLTSVLTDLPTINTLYLGTNGQSSPTYYTTFSKILLITAGNITTAELATLDGLIDDLNTVYETVFIPVLGQSNAEGRDGDTTNPAYPFQIGKGREWNGSSNIEIKDTWGDDIDIDGSWVVYFAREYFSRTGKIPVFADCAQGGTGLTATASTPNWSGGSTLRGLAETKIDSGLTALSKLAPDFCVWAQGERDAQEMDNNGAYTKAIVKSAMQDVIDWWQVTYPNVPFVISELGAYNDGMAETQGWTDMRAVQNEIVAENTGVYIGFSGAAAFKPSQMIDTLHYDYTGYTEMGEGLATYIAENF